VKPPKCHTLTSLSSHDLSLPVDVRFGSLADIAARSRHVRFTPNSRHSSVHVGRPKSAKAVIGGDTKQVCLAPVSLARKVNYHSTSGGHLDVRVASPGQGLKRFG
jgi:hypothetical protein